MSQGYSIKVIDERGKRKGIPFKAVEKFKFFFRKNCKHNVNLYLKVSNNYAMEIYAGTAGACFMGFANFWDRGHELVEVVDVAVDFRIVDTIE